MSDQQLMRINLSLVSHTNIGKTTLANIIAKMAHGIADDMLSTTVLAARCPKLVSPAMNTGMLENPITQDNLRTLERYGFTVIPSDSGVLACHDVGKGRLPAEAVLLDYLARALAPQDLAGLRVAVTAGPTHEYIDPVRFISNPSSGKMGYAIAEEAWRRGAEVTLITGPTALRRPAGIKIVEVTSADEMFDACMEASESAEVIVKAAAVGDYRPAERAEQKIKRGGKDTMTLELVQNRDIAAELGRRKRPGQLLVGFAAETQNVLENAQKKMAEKNLDMIVSNDVLAPGAGFAVDTNAVTIMARGAEPVRFSGTKDETASRILDSVSALAAGK